MVMAEGRNSSSLASETDFGRFSFYANQHRPWNSVWQRRKLSKRKLRQFFGRSAPVDVSLNEIEKYGLPALLHSNVPLCYFLYSLLEQYGAENLFFYLEVEQFQQHEFSSPEQMRKTALQLYRAFIKCNSDFEVNIDASTRRPIRLAIDAFDRHCFDSAKDHIQRLMEPCYLQFISSDIYRRMQRELEGKSIPYTEEARETAINVLLDYLDRNMPVNAESIQPVGKSFTTGSGLQPINEAQRRNNLLRAMIHAFCQTRLHLDFYDTPNRETLKLTTEQMLPPKDTLDETSINQSRSSRTESISTNKKQVSSTMPNTITSSTPNITGSKVPRKDLVEGDLTKLIKMQTQPKQPRS